MREAQNGKYAAGSVWIPTSELRERLSELPAPYELILIVPGEAESAKAVQFLRNGGRIAEFAKEIVWVDHCDPARMWSPNPFLEAYLTSQNPGTALDLGCGVGREAVLLASQGWQVVAIDRLHDAVLRGRSLAGQYGVHDSITWHIAESLSLPSIIGSDLVSILFSMDHELLGAVNDRIDFGSTLILEAFTAANAQKHGKPGVERQISPSIATRLLDGMEIIEYSEDWRPSGKHTGRLIARRAR